MSRLAILLFWAASSGAAFADLDASTQRLHEDAGLIGVATGYANSHEIIGISTYGKRQITGDDPVETDDLWHVGSITKSMTSLLLGIWLEENEGALAWTLQDAFPDFTDVDDSWQQVTLRDALDHTARLPANFGRDVMRQTDLPVTDRPQARDDALANILSQPAGPMGYEYSNVGYTLLGHFIEEQTSQPWETLIDAWLFDPLDMTSAGFGAPQGSQPFGHRSIFGFMQHAIDPSEPSADNTPLIGPAGTVHLSMEDLLKYGQELLRLSKGADGIIAAETFNQLFDATDGYSGGLGSDTNSYFGGKFYSHGGSNTMWFALLVILPEKDRVIAITTNSFDMDYDPFFWNAIVEISGF